MGFFLLAGKLTDLSLSAQWPHIMLAGGGVGLMLGPASTDAVNRAPEHELQRGHRHHPDRAQLRRQPRTGGPGRDPDQPEHTQRHRRADQAGVPGGVAHRVAASFARAAPAAARAAGQPHALVHDVQLAFAHSTQTVFYIMAGVMAATFLVSVCWLPKGRVETVDEAQEAHEPGTTPAEVRSGAQLP